ncbi:hypothetical protein DPMN_030896 [Dreissena polymorpha]|uniref:Uncharacterized protein n=1 Tax=Dreissena polymorpha TaxID=45954 RepID=A0A9D4M3I4_DREPO|nr:hypothetical protein DPMN_030896 [Dreissena polymorpha]
MQIDMTLGTGVIGMTLGIHLEMGVIEMTLGINLEIGGRSEAKTMGVIITKIRRDTTVGHIMEAGIPTVIKDIRLFAGFGMFRPGTVTDFQIIIVSENTV